MQKVKIVRFSHDRELGPYVEAWSQPHGPNPFCGGGKTELLAMKALLRTIHKKELKLRGQLKVTGQQALSVQRKIEEFSKSRIKKNTNPKEK